MATKKLYKKADCTRLADELGAEIEIQKPLRPNERWAVLIRAPDGYVWDACGCHDLVQEGGVKAAYPKGPPPETWDDLFRDMRNGLMEDEGEYEGD